MSNTTKNVKIVTRLNTGKSLRYYLSEDGTINESAMLSDFIATRKDTDTGRVGRAFELVVRSCVHMRVEKNIYHTDAVDMVSSVIGKYFGLGRSARCEIKTACGELPEREVDCVIYCPLVEDCFPMTEQAYVFTWEAWNEMLSGYSGRGSLIHVNAIRGTRHIQSFYGSESVRPKASKPIANYLWECCNGQPTVADILEEMRG